jgi:hypothetical protein
MMDARVCVKQGTTAEGVHLGAMAGTMDLIFRVSTGIEVMQIRDELHEFAGGGTRVFKMREK